VRRGREKAVLVGIARRDTTLKQAKEHLAELGRLADTAGAVVVDQVLQRRPAFDPSTLVGEGKAKEIAKLAEQHQADCVIFDEDLSGSQAKNLEEVIKTKLLDRSGLILDIFARHAKTAEAMIQVEVAQLQYLLPRLTRQWTHLSRQAGGVGIGMKGPGETQLETDRRLIRKRIADLRKKLDKVERFRASQHDRRGGAFHVALVGYTNAGKSTLMNSLTQAGVLAVDRLFATLDPTTRKLWLGPQRRSTLSDTVGFIRKLPVSLVSSFKSTLAVAAQAGFILNLVDASSGDFEEQMEITARVLKELGITETPRLMVFNKIDLLDPERLRYLREHYPDAVFLSAEKNLGLEILRERLGEAHDRAAFAASLADPHPAPSAGTSFPI
jgi:GTP-binding protein HflX